MQGEERTRGKVKDKIKNEKVDQGGQVLKKWYGSARLLFLPFSGSQGAFPLWFWKLLGILTLIKLWLVSAQTITALSFARCDDGLFVKLAQHIASGEWLGPYDNLTLAKLPFYSFWIASMSWLGIPLSYSQQLLYVFSCLIFVIAMRPLLYRNPFFCLICYTTLLFHPISYPVIEMQRVLREGIYLSLPLLVLSFAIGLLLRKDAPIKKLILWNIGLGLSFAVFWLTREEGAMLLPSLFLLLATLWVSIGLFSQEKRKRLMVCCIPILLVLVITSAVAGINKLYYGVFTICERTHGDFRNASAVLLRAAPGAKRAVMPHEARERIYKVSPAFAELRPFLEGDPEKLRGKNAPYRKGALSAHFEWALRDAAALAGYYNSAATAKKYYRRLALESNNACDQGMLKCDKPSWHAPWTFLLPPNLMPPFSAFAETMFSILRLEGININFHPSSVGSDKGLLSFGYITRDRIAPRRDSPPSLIGQSQPDAFKLHLLDFLLSVFRFYMIILMLAGIILYSYNMVLILIKRKFNKPFIISTALLLAVLARVSMLAATGYRVLYATLLYKSSIYPVLAAFFLTAIGIFFIKDNEEHSGIG